MHSSFLPPCSPLSRIWILACLPWIGAADAALANPPEYQTVLAARCLECHSGPEPEGELDLSQRSGLERGSSTGSVLEGDDWRNRLLWRVIEEGQMPPNTPLDAVDREVLRAWIAEGATLPDVPLDRLQFTSRHRAGYDWWAWSPLAAQPPPIVSPSPHATPRDPIDAWVRTGLQARGIEPNPPAPPRNLLRRVYLDLIGLPPTMEEIVAFEREPSEQAYTQVVDGLLASPRYGERWGRHWLDVARFGESDGFERNFPRHQSWHYRDWVIRALNEDLPYDDFVRMQLAGDAIVPSVDGLAAVGFLVSGLHNTVVGSSERMKRIALQDELEEKIGTLAQAFLGVTAQCARCHDHKYDPISTESFYQLSAALSAAGHGEKEWPDPKAILYTVVSQPTPNEVPVLLRGDVFQEGPRVRAGGIRHLGNGSSSFDLPATASDQERRIALADWIVTANRGLMARVAVNRLWHYHFGTGIVETPSDFGFNGGRPSHPELLEELAADFVRGGMAGKRLHRRIVLSETYRRSSQARDDALAMDADNRLLWRYPLRRLDAEAVRDSMLQISGSLRSDMGGPGYVDVEIRENNGTTYYTPLESESSDCFRRTVYRFSPRCERNAILDVLDCPDPSASAPRRAQTTSPLQAMTLLNHAFVFQMADALSQRVQWEAGMPDGADSRLGDSRLGDSRLGARSLFRAVLLREPDEQEFQMAAALVESHGLPALARALWNTSEFLMGE